MMSTRVPRKLFHALILSGTFATFASQGFGAAKPKDSPIEKVSAEDYVLDADHTTIAFSIPHLVISEVEGRFKKFSGEFSLDEAALKAGKAEGIKVKATVDVASIDTGIEKRDDHLRSPDFFDTKKFPKLTFVSTGIEGKGKELVLKGDLTIRDKTRPVKLNLDFKGTVSAYDKKRAAFKATTTFNRKDFGLVWNDAVEVGPVVGDEVTVTLVIQGLRKSDL